mgnify:CR=1 FL=1
MRACRVRIVGVHPGIKEHVRIIAGGILVFLMFYL